MQETSKKVPSEILEHFQKQAPGDFDGARYEGDYLVAYFYTDTPENYQNTMHLGLKIESKGWTRGDMYRVAHTLKEAV